MIPSTGRSRIKMVLPLLLPPPIVSFEFVIIPAIYSYFVHLLVLAIFGLCFGFRPKRFRFSCLLGVLPSLYIPFSSISEFQFLTHAPTIWVKDWAFSFYLRVESGIFWLVSDRFCDISSNMESKPFVFTVAAVNRNLVDISMTRRWGNL